MYLAEPDTQKVLGAKIKTLAFYLLVVGLALATHYNMLCIFILCFINCIDMPADIACAYMWTEAGKGD
jgi:hypothetical protein